MKLPISSKKVAMYVFALAASSAFSYFAQPRYHSNGNALTVLTTIFSIMAGFLIAVMAIVSDDRVLRGPTWRHDTAHLEFVKRDLLRHRMMFSLYLSVLCLAFVGAMSVPQGSELATWLERVLLFLACFAMLWSFRLPSYLARRHLSRLDQLLKERRDNETK